jgi:hypothetical protein
LLREYLDLVVAICALRTMIPIWGEFITRNKKVVGPVHKDLTCMGMLTNSWIYGGSAMTKLKQYISRCITDDKPSLSVRVDGVGSEEFPDWLLALAVVNRVCVAEVYGEKDDVHIISVVYHFVNSKIRVTEDPTTLRAKTNFSGKSPGDEDSIIEGFRTPAAISIGDSVIMEEGVRDPQFVLERLEPGIDQALVDLCFATNKHLVNKSIGDPQKTLVQYIVSDILPPGGIGYINKLSLVNLISVCQAVLWARGHYLLAGFVSSVHSPNHANFSITTGDSRSRIDPALIKDLEFYYPNYKNPVGRSKASKVTYPVIAAIDKLSEQIGSGSWILTMHDDLLKQEMFQRNNRRFICPREIRNSIARVIIQICKIKEAKYARYGSNPLPPSL